jgi:N-methylhydantoinase A
MLLADERHDFIRTIYSDLARTDLVKLVAVHDEMVAEAKAALRHGAEAEYQIQLDLRYVGQEFTLSALVQLANLRRGDRQGIRTAFDRLYEQRYAHHSPDEPVELVNIRLSAIGKRLKLRFPSLPAASAATVAGEREVYFSSTATPLAAKVYRRQDIGAGVQIAGPALIQEHGTTTLLFEQDRCEVAPSGELIVTIGGAS